MAEDKLAGLQIDDEQETTTQGGAVATRTEAKPPSVLQQVNDEFEGLGDSDFAARVVLDGNQILYKDREEAVDKIEIQLTGGRKVYQYFDEPSNTYHKSYDGKFTEEGEPVSNFPGMRHMFELDWKEEVDGELVDHQLVLSPTSRYSFVDYAKKLAKLTPPKKVSEVTTIITAVRKQNKDGQRYSQAEFTCKELM